MSQYGSIDETLAAKKSDIRDEELSQIPPRPAIRQRQSRNYASLKQESDDCSSSTGKPVADQTNQTSVSCDELRINQGRAIARELNAINRSLLAAKNNPTALELPGMMVEGKLTNVPQSVDLKDAPELEQPTVMSSDRKEVSLALSELENCENNNNNNQIEHKSPKRAYPKRALFIITNEFCERFSYYGLRTVLVLYFKSVLGFSDANSTVSFHLFATLCYLTPILGAILGDSVWGKFKTILYLSIVYLCGEIVLVLSSIFSNEGLIISTGGTFLGLFMIGLGTGGIKPCVSALGGDQFLPHEEKWRQGFFSLFYGAINLGSLISTFLTPMLRSEYKCFNRADCYPLAFGLPCLLMFLSIIVFLMGKNQYNIVPLPEKNVIVAFCQCVWLALKRKLCGNGDTILREAKLMAQHRTPHDLQTLSGASSTSSLTVSSQGEGGLNQAVYSNQQPIMANKSSPAKGNTGAISSYTQEEPHWLYLASDQFDTQTIEDFRSVLALLLVFVPIPVYWCLFDQQGSLWTLQATRMDGRIFNTNFILQPDQMHVLNPLLLLTAIPVFEMIIYPSLESCNILKRPIQRITVGGLLAALTFVLSALIELRIQQFQPPIEAPSGHANLLFVNGLSECTIINPSLSYLASSNNNETFAPLPDASQLSQIKQLKPLSAKSVEVPATNASYQIQFKLSHEIMGGGEFAGNQQQHFDGCPFDPKLDYELSIGAVPEKSARLLYLEQGNGKLSLRSLNDSRELPSPGKARVRLLYEFFGSSAQAEKHQFHLIRTAEINSTTSGGVKFPKSDKTGQILISPYIDVAVTASGDYFSVKASDYLVPYNSFRLEQGTRNLIIVHQRDASNVEIRNQLLQDNHYRISLLWQIGPYLLISVSEVLFSITGLEFSYSMAPANMKSVILGAWSLTVAFGNILTVAIESLHLFSNIAHDFLFYAAIMALDMVLFALVGHYYQPHRPTAQTETATNTRL